MGARGILLSRRAALHNYMNVLGPTWRGMGQSMRAAVIGKNGGANRSVYSRTRHYSNISFRRFRIVIPVFEIIGTPLVDTLFSGSQTTVAFQVGFEYPYASAVTGLAARVPVTFGGVNYKQYVSGSWDANFGYIISDVIDAGQNIPAGALFGLHMTVELPAGSYSNALPFTITGTNFNERWVGQQFAAVSQIAALGGSSDVALASATITKAGTTQSGASGMFTPAMMLIEVPRSYKCVAVLGDSISYGNNEGQTGSGAFGDSMGSALGNAGYVDRGLFEVCAMNGFNISKGSDGNKYWATTANWKYRRQLAALGAPTHFINAGLHNDITPSITIAGWAATTAYLKYDVKSSSSNLYMCEQAGTSGSSALAGTGTAIADGTCVWRYLGPLPGAAIPRGWAQVFAQIASTHDQIKLAMPDVKLVMATALPFTSSTDSWATAVNQTVDTSSGDGTSRRGLINAQIRAKHSRLFIDTVIDGNPYLEDSYPTETSKWVSGAANFVTQDGTHHNSKGADLAKAALSLSLFS